MSLRIHVLKPNPQCSSIKRWDLQQVISPWSLCPCQWGECPCKRGLTELLLPPAMGVCSNRAPVFEAESKPPPGTESANALTLDFPVSRTVNNTFTLLINYQFKVFRYSTPNGPQLPSPICVRLRPTFPFLWSVWVIGFRAHPHSEWASYKDSITVKGAGGVRTWTYLFCRTQFNWQQYVGLIMKSWLLSSSVSPLNGHPASVSAPWGSYFF